jgi:hypothetical protein
LHGTSKFYLDGRLVGQVSAQRRPGVRPFSQSFLGKSNWGHDAFLNGQIFYFQQLNTVISDAHQRTIFDRLKVAANSVIGYIPASVQRAPVAPLDLRDDALPCGDNLLANEGLTNDEGTARLVMQADGNLVLYNRNGKALWNSGTAGSINDRLEVQADGNLVVCDARQLSRTLLLLFMTLSQQVPGQPREVGVSLQHAPAWLRVGGTG